MEPCNEAKDARSSRLGRLSDILDKISTEEDVQALTRSMCDGLANTIQAPFGWVVTLDATRRLTSLPSSHTTDAALLERILTGSVAETVVALVSWVPVEGMTLILDEEGDAPDWLDAGACREAGLSRILLQPLAASAITEGLILIGSGSEMAGGELAADLKLFSTAASLAIQQALSFAELKRSEEDMVRHRTGRLRALRQWASTIDAMDSMFVITDRKGMVRRLNRSVADHLGLSFQDIIGQPMSSFFGQLPQIDESISGNIPKTAEVIVPFTEGIYELSCFPNLDPEGERIGVIFIFRDITEEKRIREHLLEAEKLSTLSGVLSGVAHEMNNPLAAVMGFAQLALELSTEPPVQECLTTVQVETEHVTRIVRNLLAFARRTRPIQAPVSLPEVIAGSTDLVSYELRVANIRLTTDVPNDLPDILGDQHQLNQAMVAILLFVAHATHRGNGKGTLEVLATKEAANRVQIRFLADGVSMTEGEIDSVFELPATGAQEESAERIGLAVAYGTVTQHGGTISATGGPGSGLSFLLEFPGLAAGDQQAELSPDDEPLDARGLQALVADDDEVAARLVSNVLQMAGATVDVVSDGEHAWESARDGDYDILVTDLRMPGMDGSELLSRLDEAGSPLARQAVMVTGDTMSLETTEFLEASGLPYLTKPFTLAAVRRAIRIVLSAKTAGEGESGDEG
ncbi:MAG: response regulator [Deltaproteobacteria bacterium]|nr:response regulator [Deltaproteobacteria bacterium]